MNEKKPVIDVSKMTFAYRSGKGIFDLTFDLAQGEVLGCLGPNGAGKTTTIRALLGFIRPGQGSCRVYGRDCFLDAAAIHRRIGFLPGEVALPDLKGSEFLDLLARLHQVKVNRHRSFLLDLFELDPHGHIRHFSKGMRQKLALVAALQHDPACLILDEPTSGLDPLMRQRFIELLLEEKARGKTIFLSSHSFTEVERSCDSVLLIKEGRLVKQAGVAALKQRQLSSYLVLAKDSSEARDELAAAGFAVELQRDGWLSVAVEGQELDRLLKQLARLEILGLDIRQQTLADAFFEFYKKEG